MPMSMTNVYEHVIDYVHDNCTHLSGGNYNDHDHDHEDK